MKKETNAKLLSLIANDNKDLFIKRAIAFLCDKLNVVQMLSEGFVTNVIRYDKFELKNYLKEQKGIDATNINKVEFNVDGQCCIVYYNCIRFGKAEDNSYYYYNTEKEEKGDYNKKVEVESTINLYEIEKLDFIEFEYVWVIYSVGEYFHHKIIIIKRTDVISHIFAEIKPLSYKHKYDTILYKVVVVIYPSFKYWFGCDANPSPTLYFPSSLPPYIIQDNIPAEPIAFIAILKKYVL